jgi:hypothetical protein
MHTAGMLTFTTAPQVVHDLFAVPKSDGKLRLILDGRRLNAICHEPDNPNLPDPSLLSSLQLKDTQTLFVAKADVSNAFYAIKMPARWFPFFCLKSIKAGELNLQDFEPSQEVWPALTVLAMGWNHSCLIMQESHLKTILKAFPQSCLITSTSDNALDRVRMCLYLDDTTFFGTVKAEVDEAVTLYSQQAQTDGWPLKQEKCSEAAEIAESLGYETHGRFGTIGVSPTKLHQLKLRTLSLISVGMASSSQLSSLIGSWTWAILIRRPLLAVLSASYRFIELDHTRPLTIWPSVKRELQTLCDLAPLMVGSLRTKGFDQVVATDASQFGTGVVAATVPVSKQQDWWRSALAARSPNSGETTVRPNHVNNALLPSSQSGETTVRPNHVNNALLPSSQSGETTVRPQKWRRRPAPEAISLHSLNNPDRASENSAENDGKQLPDASQSILTSSCYVDHHGSRPTAQFDANSASSAGSWIPNTTPVSEALPTRVQIIPTGAISSVKWTTILSHADRWIGDHINCRELGAILAGLSWLIRHSSAPGSRFTIISDSTVSLCALAKGRTSSFRLLSRIRAINATLLASQSQLQLFYVPSASNPADKASRLTRTSWLSHAIVL